MAGSKSIGGVFATLSIKDVNFNKKLKSAGDSMAKFGTSALKVGAVAAAGIGAGLAIGTKHALSMGGELTDLSAQTGVAISDLMRIQQAYKDNGREASAAGKDINKMQKAIVDASNDPMNDPFASIGLSVDNLMSMNPSQQFFAIGDAIKRIQDPAKQAAASMKIFGKGGGELLAVFKGTSLDEVNQTLGKSVEVMEQFASKFDQVDDALERLPNKANQFFIGFTAGVVDQVIPALDQVNGYDFTDIGRSVGEFFGAAIALFGDDTTWDLFVLNAELAFAKILNLPVFKELTAAAMLITGDKMDVVRPFVNGGYVEQVEGKIQGIYDQIAEKASAEAVKIDQDRRKNKVDPMAGISGAALSGISGAIVAETIAPTIAEAVTMTAPSAASIDIPEVQSRQIDEYQRRGLSLSKNPGVVQDRLLSVQEQIRDILKSAKIQGKELVWS